MDKTLESEPDVKKITPLMPLKAKAGEYIERKVIDHVLNMTGGNKTEAAKTLNISYKALFYKMKNLGLIGRSANGVNADIDTNTI